MSPANQVQVFFVSCALALSGLFGNLLSIESKENYLGKGICEKNRWLEP